MKLNAICLFSAFIFLVVVIGLRDQTGSDWNYYLDFYKALGSNFEVENYFETGYYLYSKIFSSIGFSYQTFLFLSTLIYLILFFYVFNKKEYSSLLVLLFYSSHLLGLMGQARQIYAVAFCLMAGQFLLDGKKRYFIVMVLLAASFHKSALIFLLAYFATKYKYRNVHFAFAMLCALAFEQLSGYWSVIIEFLSNYFPIISSQLLAYLSSPDNVPIFFVEDPLAKALMFVKRGGFGLLFIYSEQFIIKFKNEYLFYLNNYLLSLFIFFTLYGTFPAIAVRLSFYFYIYDIFLLSIIVVNAHKLYKFFAFFVVVLICAQRLWTPFSIDADFLAPYKGIFFINESLVRDMPG